MNKFKYVSSRKTPTDIISAFVGAFIVAPLLGGWALQYVLEFWLKAAKAPIQHVAFLACVVASFFIGRYAIAAWVLTLLFGYLVRS